MCTLKILAATPTLFFGLYVGVSSAQANSANADSDLPGGPKTYVIVSPSGKPALQKPYPEPTPVAIARPRPQQTAVKLTELPIVSKPLTGLSLRITGGQAESTADSLRFKTGEVVTLQLTPRRSGHVYVMNVDGANQPYYLLYPRARNSRDDARRFEIDSRLDRVVQANATVSVDVRFEGEPGIEKLFVVVSDVPLTTDQLWARLDESHDRSRQWVDVMPGWNVSLNDVHGKPAGIKGIGPAVAQTFKPATAVPEVAVQSRSELFSRFELIHEAR